MIEDNFDNHVKKYWAMIGGRSSGKSAITETLNPIIEENKALKARVKELEDKLELAESLIDDNSYSYYIYESSKAGE